MHILNRCRAALKKSYIDIHITDHCNLNCKYCAHFSPVSDVFELKKNDLEETYKKLKPIYDIFFNSIHLLGGEPTLHRHLIDILLLTRKYFPETEIQLITNGLKLLKMENDFWETCRQNAITLYISKYNITFNYNQVIDICRKYNVKYIIENTRSEFIHHKLEKTGNQNPLTSYSHCKFGGSCLQLRHNRIYPCPQSAYIDILNKKFNSNCKHSKFDFIPLDKLHYRIQMIAFILFPKPFCKYCNTKDEYFAPWEQSNSNESEWFNI